MALPVMVLPSSAQNLQYFLLDSEAGGYSDARTALLLYPSASEIGVAAHDATLKILQANITESQLNSDADLVDLRTVNYPTELCRHRWNTINDFLCCGGFHMMGESESSSEAIAGRSAVHVTRTGGGAGDGTTLYDAIAYLTMTSFANGTLTMLHGNLWQTRDGALNARTSKFIASAGAATDADSINIRGDAGLTPAVFVDGQDISNGIQYTANGTLGWTSVENLFGTGCYIKSTLAQPHNSVSVNNRQLMVDAGVDPFANTTQLEDYVLERVATAGELSAESTCYNGRGGSTSCSLGAPDAAIQDDGGAFTDLTTEVASADTADVPMFPATAVANDAFYVGHGAIYSAVNLTLSTAGAGDYVLAKEYWNGSSWAAIPAGTWHGQASSVDWKATAGYAGNSPRFIFNPPDDWATTTVNSQGPFYYIRFRFASGTMSTSPVASIGRVESTFYVVHLKDGAEPTTVLPGELGLGIGCRPGTQAGQAQLINLTMLGCDALLTQFSGSNALPQVFRIKGGRYLEGDTGYGGWGSVSEFHIGAAEDRVPPWDTSDRPNSSNESALAQLVTDGAAPSDFTAEAVAKFMELKYATVGPHPTNTVGGAPTTWNMDGVIFDKIGENHKGIDRSGNADKHMWATRGLKIAGTHRRIICRDGYAMFYAYMTSDTNNRSPIGGNCIDIGPLTFDDIAFINFGTTNPPINIGHFAMRFGGDSGNGNLRDSGVGLRDITFGRIVCKNLIEPDMDNAGVINWTWDQNPSWTAGGKMTFIGCTRGLASGGSTASSVVYVVAEDNGTGFTDHTADNYDETTFNAFPATPAVNDAIYFGFNRFPFRTAIPNIITSGVGSGLTTVWEYWNGSAWTAISTGGSFSDATAALTAATGNRTLVFDRPSDWAKTDSGGDLVYNVHWLRLRITAGTYTTAPQITGTNGPVMGSYYVSEDADRLEFIDMEGPWMGVIGLNSGYDIDGRTAIFDRFKGRLKSGETIAAFNMFFRAGSGTDNMYTLSQAKGGSLDKAFATTEVHEDNAGKIAANVSTTPDVDIIEVE